MNYIKHFITITKHKFIVFKLCCKAGIPFQGIIHDNSKYSFTEFLTSAKFYNGNYSPIMDERKVCRYSKAWLHHKGRNKHHFEYWLDPYNKEKTIIPYKYMVEMICDNVAASITYCKKEFNTTCPYNYFKKNNKYMKQNINKKYFKMYERVVKDLSKTELKNIINKKYLKDMYQKYVID